MTLLDRLEASDIAPMPRAPVLVLTQLGVAPELFERLAGEADDLVLAIDKAEFVFEIAKAWHGLSQFDPLVRHRFSGEETPPDHPWYGAERTDPDAMALAMAQAVQLQIGREGKRLMLVSPLIFWELSDCRPLVDFVLGWGPDARVLMVTSDTEQAAMAVAHHHRWQLAPSEGAVKAMDRVFAALKDELGKRAMIWAAPDEVPDILPDAIIEFIV